MAAAKPPAALLLLALARWTAGQPAGQPARQAEGPDAAQEVATRRPPHIVFFLVDDLGWHNVGFHNPMVHTPAIDSLRAQGVELTRHYAYKFCSPSRTSLLSGRLPAHVNERNKITEAPMAGVPPEMTTIPAMLKSAGYKSHHVGKWHAGMASRSKSIPIARGFDSSLGFFHGQQDHYTQVTSGNVCPGQAYTDLWLNDGPAVGLNGTKYSLHLWRDYAMRVLQEHDPSTPLFLLMAFLNTHDPLQVPEEYMRPYPANMVEDWRIYQGMITAVDATIAEIVGALHRKGMWENSLVVWTSDNGGLVGPRRGPASNYPLRGGKLSNFEGAFRVPTVVSGGRIPRWRHNTNYTGVTHFADWYATFAAFAGLSTEDRRAAAAGLPAVDGKDLRGALLRGASSPWAGQPLLLSSHAADPVLNPQTSAVLLLDDHKLITGFSWCSAWTGPVSPNASARAACSLRDSLDCGSGGCLFNVASDPGEHQDLAALQPARLAQLQEALAREVAGVYDPDRGEAGDAPCQAAKEAGGYWAPYLP